MTKKRVFGPRRLRPAVLFVGLLGLSFILCSPPAMANETLSESGIVVTYPEGFEREARATVELYKTSRADLTGRFGIRPAEPVSVLLCATAEEFNAVTGGRYDPGTLGLAYPRRNEIVINCSRLGAEGYDSLGITVRHEVCHLAVSAMERTGGHAAPLWFNEGLAVYTSGRMPLPGEGWLPTFVARDVAIPLRELETNFPANPASLRVAYEESVDILRFLARQYSEQVLRDICMRMAAGASFEQALQAASGLTTAQLEQQWLGSMGLGNTLLAWVLRHFSIFSIMSLLALAAFLRYLIRRHRAMRRWTMEEDPPLPTG